MNQIKAQIVNKLNAIVELVRHCATKVLPTKDQSLMQEVTLAVVTHDGLCKLFEKDGPTENVVALINEFGNAIAELYRNISTFQTLDVERHIHVNELLMPPKRAVKNLLN